MPQAVENIDKVIHQLPDVQVTARRRKRDPRRLHSEEQNITTYEVKKDFSYVVESGENGALSILDYIPQVRLLGAIGKGGAIDGTVLSGTVPPAYILDGIRVGKEVLVSIAASAIERVEVLTPTQAMMYGSGLYAGAVAFFSRSWEDKVSGIPLRTIAYQFPGYTQQKEFYVPNYSTPSDYFKLDARNTLHWQPYVRLGEDGKGEVAFYTSDDEGEYVILCEGRSIGEVIGVATCFINKKMDFRKSK
jgi:hypothetical protein